MSAAEFDTQFNRLTAHFHLPTDASRETVAVDWYRAVQHYHVDALERGVTRLIVQAEDRFWPALGALLEAVRWHLAGVPKTHIEAAWVEAQPFKSNRMIYGNVCVRNPESGIPAPLYQESTHREGLTHQEMSAWRSGDRGDYMPDGMKAKPRPEGEKTEIRAAMERLRVKLFGMNVEDGAA